MNAFTKTYQFVQERMFLIRWAVRYLPFKLTIKRVLHF